MAVLTTRHQELKLTANFWGSRTSDSRMLSLHRGKSRCARGDSQELASNPCEASYGSPPRQGRGEGDDTISRRQRASMSYWTP